MSEKTYCTIAGVIFAIGALVHLGRLSAGWELVIAGWTAPIWVSWIGMSVAAALAAIGLWLGARESV